VARPVSISFLVTALLIAWLAQVALYWPTLQQMPVGDDWGPPLTEIVRGERVGPSSFFTETRQPDSYRPMQSLLMWLFGRVEEPYRWPSIRALHFLSSAVAGVVLGLLLHAWRLGRAGVVVAAIVAAIHPTLVAPVGSIDGFSSVLSCAAVWWGVWLMWQWRDKPAVATAFAGVALVVGTLVKEYAFAMAPTGVLAAFMFMKPRWRSTVVSAFALGALTVLLLWARRYVKPTDMDLPPSDFEFDSLQLLVQNAALVLVGGFFFGDALWLYVERSVLAIGVSVTVLAVTAALLLPGLAKWWSAGQTESPDRRWLLGFLLLSIPAVTFPANLVMRMSEMYLCGLVFTVALLAGLAADGWGRASQTTKRVALVGFVGVCVASMAAIVHKNLKMVELGKRSRLQTDQLVQLVANAPAGSKVALLYRLDQVPARPTFSSYRLPERFHVRPPATDYLFPGRRIELITPPALPDEAAVRAADRSIADIVLYWDVAAGRFERLK
jgi:hypothetical protein